MEQEAPHSAASGVPEPRPWPWRRGLLALAIAVPALLRLTYCCLQPAVAGDLDRHLIYGALVARDGLAMAGRPLVELFGLQAELIAWGPLPYNYPPVPLLFFTVIAAVWPVLFLARLALSVVEAANAWMIWRLSGRLAPALIYWAAPVTLLWSSREGQFEALQNGFTLLALLCLGACGPRPLAARWRPLAWIALALAVQTKLSAVLLLPWFAWQAWREGRGRALLRGLGFFVVAFVPLLPMQLAYPLWHNVLTYSAPLQFNPYHWDVLSQRYFGWAPDYVIWGNQLATWGLLLALGAWLVRGPQRLAVLAPLAFVVLLKTHTNVQFWYWLLLPPLLLPLVGRGERASLHVTLLFVLWLTLDVFGTRHVLLPPAAMPETEEKMELMHTAFTPHPFIVRSNAHP